MFISYCRRRVSSNPPRFVFTLDESTTQFSHALLVGCEVWPCCTRKSGMNVIGKLGWIKRPDHRSIRSGFRVAHGRGHYGNPRVSAIHSTNRDRGVSSLLLVSRVPCWLLCRTDHIMKKIMMYLVHSGAITAWVYRSRIWFNADLWHQALPIYCANTGQWNRFLNMKIINSDVVLVCRNERFILPGIVFLVKQMYVSLSLSLSLSRITAVLLIVHRFFL